MKSIITQAGKYKVEQLPSPRFPDKSDLTKPPTGVLHTTEGGWAGSYSILHHHFAPHFMVGLNASYHAAKRLAILHPKDASFHDHPAAANPTDGVEIAQLVPLGYIGAAQKAHNAWARAEIEVIGYAKEDPWIFDDKTLDALASLLNVLKIECGIPLSRPWPDGVYGRAGKTAHRNEGKFGTIAGWYCHGDCPSPDTHWDIGNLQYQKLWDHCTTLEKESELIS